MAQRCALALVCAVAALVLASCPDAAGPEELLRAGDTIKPAIIITSHHEGDPFAEPTTTITGAIADTAKADGTAGQVVSSSWAVQGSTAGGTLTLAADGTFSFEVNTEARATELGVVITAADWNGNVEPLTLTLAVPKEITSFAFEAAHNPYLPFDAVGTIDGIDIEVLVATGTVRTALVATFETTGASVKVAGVEQQSGATANDFRSPVTYAVTGKDGRSKDYTVTVTEVTEDYGAAQAPSFSPEPNTYDHDISVALSTTTPGGVIYYSTDGSPPTPSSARWTTPIAVAGHGTAMTIWAITYAPGYTPSDASGSYTIVYPAASKPSCDGEPGVYLNPIQVTLSSTTPGAQLYYTTNGDEPTLSSTQCTGPIGISGDGTVVTIKAVAVATGYSASPVLTSGPYTIWYPWEQEAYLKAPNPDANDQFGCSVAISGDTVVIGAPYEDSNQTTITNGTGASSDNTASLAGAAYVLVRSGGTWSQQAFLKAPNAGAGDWFGDSVAVSGDTVVVGAEREDSNQTTITNGDTASSDNSASDAGAAYVFVRSGTSWSQQAYLKAPNAGAGDWFGNSVAVSGDTVVVGARGERSNQTTITNGSTASGDNSADGAGAAYVFVRSGASWSQQAYLKAPNAESGDFFGNPVAVSGDTVVVGANGEDSGQTTITNGSTASSDNSATEAGAAYVFVRSGTTWSQQAYLKAPNAESGDYFNNVAISGDTVVVGASLEDSGQTTITNGSTASSDNSATYAGAAYVFVRTDAAWSQQAYLKAPNAEANDYFGWVGVSGDTVVIGAYGEDSSQTTITNGSTASSDNSATDAGAAYVFVRSGTTWSQRAYLKAPNADAGDHFGIPVGVSGNTVVVGAREEDSNQTTITNGATASSSNAATDAGAAYVFFYD